MKRQSTLFKAVSVYLIVASLFTTLAPGAFAPMPAAAQGTDDDSIRGDITGDGVVDGRDALKIMRVVEGYETATPEEVARGDVYPLPGTAGRLMGDGQLTQEDAEKILRGAVGLIPEGEITGDFSGSLPMIDSLFPTRGPIGTQVFILGANFVADSPGDNVVLFGDVPAPVLSSTGTELVVEVPSGAESGRVRVTTPGGEAVSPMDFIVTVERSGLLVPPAGFSPADYYLLNKFGDLVEAGSDGTFSMPADVRGVTLLYAVPLDDSDRILASLEIGTGWGAEGGAVFQEETRMDLLSTAQTLVFLSYHFTARRPEYAQAHMTYIRDDPKVAELAQVLEQLYRETDQPFDDPRFEEAYQAAILSVMERVPEEYALDLEQAGASSLRTRYRVFHVPIRRDMEGDQTRDQGALHVLEQSANDDGDVWPLWNYLECDSNLTFLDLPEAPGTIPTGSRMGNPVDWVMVIYEVSDLYNTFPRGLKDVEDLEWNPLKVLPKRGNPQSVILESRSYAKLIDIFGLLFGAGLDYLVKDLLSLGPALSPDQNLYVHPTRDAVYVVRAFSGEVPVYNSSHQEEYSFTTVSLSKEDHLSAFYDNVLNGGVEIVSIFMDASSCFDATAGRVHGRLLKVIKSLKKALKVAGKKVPSGTISNSRFWPTAYQAVKDIATVLVGDCLEKIATMVAKAGLLKLLKAIAHTIDPLYKISMGLSAADRFTALMGKGLMPVTPLETWIVMVGDPFAPEVISVPNEPVSPGEEVTLRGKNFDYRSVSNNEVRLGKRFGTWQAAARVEVTSVNSDGTILKFRVPEEQVEGEFDIWIKTPYSGGPLCQERQLVVKRIPKLQGLSRLTGFPPVPPGTGGPFADYQGTLVVLEGAGLEPSEGAPADKVFFGTVEAPIERVSATEVEVRVPQMNPGTTEVYIVSPEHGVETAHYSFTVFGGPQLSSITPTTDVQAGQYMEATGSNFSLRRDEMVIEVKKPDGSQSGHASILSLVSEDEVSFQMPNVGQEGDPLEVVVWTPAGSSNPKRVTRRAGVTPPDPLTSPETRAYPLGYRIYVRDPAPGRRPGNEVSLDEADGIIRGEIDPFDNPWDDRDVFYEWIWDQKIVPDSCWEDEEAVEHCDCYYDEEPDSRSEPLYSYHEGDFDFDSSKGHPGAETAYYVRRNRLEPKCNDGESGLTDPSLFKTENLDMPEEGEQVDCESGGSDDDCPEEGDFISYLSDKEEGGQGHSDLIYVNYLSDEDQTFHGGTLKLGSGDRLIADPQITLDLKLGMYYANQASAEFGTLQGSITIEGDNVSHGTNNEIQGDVVRGGVTLRNAKANTVTLNWTFNAAHGVKIEGGGLNDINIYTISGIAGHGIFIQGSLQNSLDIGIIRDVGMNGILIQGGGLNRISHSGTEGKIINAGWSGIMLDDTYANEVHLDIENAGDYGVHFKQGGLNSVGGTVDTTGKDGILFEEGEENRFSGARTKNAGGNGVTINGGCCHTVHTNIEGGGSTHYGFLVENSSFNDLSGGAKNCTNIGLYIHGGEGNDVTGFTAEKNGTPGVKLVNTKLNVLVVELLDHPGGDGVWVGESSQHNWIIGRSRNDRNGVVLTGPNTYGNSVDVDVENNRRYGVLLENGTHDNSIGGSVHTSTLSGVYVGDGAYSNRISTSVFDSGDHGILLENTERNEVGGGEIAGNGGDGIHIPESATMTTIGDALFIHSNQGNGITVRGQGTTMVSMRGLFDPALTYIGARKADGSEGQPNGGVGILVDGLSRIELKGLKTGINRGGGIRIMNINQQVNDGEEPSVLVSLENILIGAVDAGTQGYGLYLENVTDVRMSGVHVRGHQEGIFIGGERPARYTIDDSTISGSAERGLVLFNVEDATITVAESDAGAAGIHLLNAKNIVFGGKVRSHVFKDFRTERNGGPGIEIDESENIAITYGWVTGNADHGIFVDEGSRDVSIVGPWIEHNDASGIRIKGASDVVVRSGGEDEVMYIQHNGGAGIVVEDSQDVRIVSDGSPEAYIALNEKQGILIKGEQTNSVTVSGWPINSNGEEGIRVEGGSNVRIGGFTGRGIWRDPGNDLAGNPVGIVAEGADTDVLIMGNSVVGSGLAAFYQVARVELQDSDDEVQIVANKAAYPADTPQAETGIILGSGISEAVIVGNTIKRCLTDGILLLSGAHHNVIGENIITQNLTGVKIAGAHDNLIEKNTITNNSVGVLVDGQSAIGNTINHNSITRNLDKGIQLVNGGNRQVESPVIERVSQRTYSIAGTVDAPAGSRVEVYADSDDEGALLLGAGTVVGNGFKVSGAVPPGVKLHATVTHLDGSTSEFGPAMLAGSRGSFAFTSTRDGNQEIYFMIPGMVSAQRLTNRMAADHSPKLCSGYTDVLFVSDAGGNPDLWMVSTDGSGLEQITQDPAAEYDPACSPDGQKIVYVSEGSIYSTNMEGGSWEDLAYDDGEADGAPSGMPAGGAWGVHFTKNPASQSVSGESSLPADGTNTLPRIKFFIGKDPAEFKWQVYEFAGGQPGALIAEGNTTPTDVGWHTVDVNLQVPSDFLVAIRYLEDDKPKLGFDLHPWESERSYWDFGYGWERMQGYDFIMIRASYPVGAERLTDDSGTDRHPDWCSDGTKLAFTSDRSGNQEIWVMNADGTNPQQLTNHPAPDYKPAWSPDCTKIAFVSERDGNPEIYLMDANSANLTRLTDNPGPDTDPAWLPDGQNLLFSSDRNAGMEIYSLNLGDRSLQRLTNSLGDNTQPHAGVPGNAAEALTRLLAWLRTRKGAAERGSRGVEERRSGGAGGHVAGESAGTSVQVAVQFADVMPGETFTVPVTLSGAQSLGYLGFDIAYDPIRLTLLAATPGEFTNSGLFALNPELYPDDLGFIRFSWVRAAGFSGDGTVLNLTFQVDEEAGGAQIPLAFQNPGASDVGLGEVTVAPQDGQVDVTACTLAEPSVAFVSAEPGESVRLTARVTNAGDTYLPAGLSVNFYLGDPSAGGTLRPGSGQALITTAVTTEDLFPDETEEVTATWEGEFPGDHIITIVADYDGTEEFPLCGVAPTVQQDVSILDVHLVESWSLVSSYVNPFNTDIGVVQRPISGTYVAILGYDEGERSYYPDRPPEENTLTDMDAEHGYWIKAVSGQQSAVSGQTPTVAALRLIGTAFPENHELALDSDWNLVSYLPRNPLTVTNALQTIDGQYTAVLGFEQGALSYYPHLDPIFNTLTTLEPLHGYWIRTAQPVTLTYPTTEAGLMMAEENAVASVREAERTAGVTPTNTWVNIYGAAHLLDGTPLPVGVTVEALDPDGVVCGATVIAHEGYYGLLACYGDDPTTPEDEGATPGDVLTFTIDGHEATASQEAVWAAFGDLMEVNLETETIMRPRMYLPLVERGNADQSLVRQSDQPAQWRHSYLPLVGKGN